MKNFLIMVLSGAYNLGDELILRAEIDLLQKKFPDAKCTIATYDQNSFFGSRENCRFISFFPNNIKRHFLRNIGYFFQTIRQIARADAIVIGGGGIFFDNEPGISFSKNLFEWRLRLFFARLFFKKVIFLGISIEVKNEENQKKLAKIFHKNDSIFPRDERSTAILKKFGIIAETLYDSVFLMPPKARNFLQKPKKIGISLRWGFWNDTHIVEFQKFLNYLEKEWYEIIFLSHAFTWGENHNDVLFVEKFFGKKHAITATMQETFDAYKDVDFVISMRLHATIVASMHSIPVIMIPYGPKTLALAEILEITDSMIDIKHFEYGQFEQKFLYVCNNYHKMQGKIEAQYRKIHTNFLQKLDKIDIIEV